MTFPPEFWIWAAWRDKGGIPPRPAAVTEWIKKHGPIPKTWWARYLIHKGIVKPVQKVIPNKGPAQYILFAASEPLAALAAPAKYGVALSADPAFRDYATPETVAALRFKGHRVYAWCDCDATPASSAIALRFRLGLDGWIGQAETPTQFGNAWAAGAPVIVGNRSALQAHQLDLLDAARANGTVLWIQEDFWNEGWALDRSACDAVMHGIYPTNLWNPAIYNYKVAGRWVAGDGLFHVAAVRDWNELP